MNILLRFVRFIIAYLSPPVLQMCECGCGAEFPQLAMICIPHRNFPNEWVCRAHAEHYYKQDEMRRFDPTKPDWLGNTGTYSIKGLFAQHLENGFQTSIVGIIALPPSLLNHLPSN